MLLFPGKIIRYFEIHIKGQDLTLEQKGSVPALITQKKDAATLQ